MSRLAPIKAKPKIRQPNPKQKHALSSHQTTFANLVAKGENVSSASLKAYKNRTTGYDIIKNPDVIALIDKQKAKFEAEAQMDRRQVMEGLKEAIDMGRLMAEPMTMIAGWREIGKLCGYYAPVETRLKVDITGNVTMTKLNALSDAELLQMIEQGATQGPTPAPELLEHDDPAP